MDAMRMLEMLKAKGLDFFTGVPDSLLKEFCDGLMSLYGDASPNHIVAQNEGGCVGLAAGHYLATGRVPCVYMQNSGIGNAVNPIASLANNQVYGIPILFIVGWRGQPGVHDEPQHVFQGQITIDLLRVLDIDFEVIGPGTDEGVAAAALDRFAPLFAAGKSAALVVEKNTFTPGPKYSYKSSWPMAREDALKEIAQFSAADVVVSSTGKISRELFEIRESTGAGHSHDFLTVGSMGHSAMIALGIALEQTARRVWCAEGDGSYLMHMGALAVVGSRKPPNFVHVVLNNGAHETVGGMPTAAFAQNIPGQALAAGYAAAERVDSRQALEQTLRRLEGAAGPVMLEVMVGLGSRKDLGRPTTTPQQNKEALMEYLFGKE